MYNIIVVGGGPAGAMLARLEGGMEGFKDRYAEYLKPPVGAATSFMVLLEEPDPLG